MIFLCVIRNGPHMVFGGSPPQKFHAVVAALLCFKVFIFVLLNNSFVHNTLYFIKKKVIISRVIHPKPRYDSVTIITNRLKVLYSSRYDSYFFYWISIIFGTVPLINILVVLEIMYRSKFQKFERKSGWRIWFSGSNWAS